MISELVALSLDLIAHLLTVELQFLNRGVGPLREFQHSIPFRFQQLHALLELRLALLDCRVQTDARMFNVSAHEEAMGTDHHATLRTKERKSLPFMRVALSVANRLHGRDNMRLEDSSFLGMTSLQTSLTVLDDASHTFHDCWLLLAYIALELLPDGGFLCRLPLLRSFKLFHHILQRQIERKSLNAICQGARSTTNRAVDGQSGDSLISPQTSSTLEADVVRVTTWKGARISEEHETHGARELILEILCKHVGPGMLGNGRLRFRKK